MISYGRTSKYNAKKTSYRGARYDSKKEAEYAELLDGLVKQGLIKTWRRQERFPLPDLNWFETQSKRSYYSADFIAITPDGREHVIEVKGVLTTENKIKYAFWKYVYERPLHIIHTTGLEKFNTNWLSCDKCPIPKTPKK